MLKFPISTLFLVGLLCLAIGCGKDSSANAAKPSGPQGFPVKVMTVEAQVVPQYTDYLATLKSRSASTLQPQVEGDITKIFVRSGQHVDAGAPLLEIDPRKQEATVNNQEAALKSKLATVDLTRTDLERKKKLYSAGVIAKADLDTSQSAYDAARADAEGLEASIREQKVQLRYYTVNAPGAGIVGDIPVRVGDHVTNQTVLTTLDLANQLEAYVYVPAEKSGSVHVGTPIELLDDQGKPAARAQVFFVSPHIDTDSQTLLVKAMVPNSGMKFRNAQQVEARVIWSESKQPLVPVIAVSRLSGKLFAYVAEGEGQKAVARQRLLTVGDMVGNDYVVLDGIHAGDKLIVTGVQMLADGMPVIPQS